MKLSDVSERKKERESIVSNVVASPPEDDKQVPEDVSKHPAESLIPLLKEEVALEVRRIFPPEMVNPFEEERPPALVDEIPPAKVEVALFPCMVVVAVPPTVIVVREERALEEALANL